MYYEKYQPLFDKAQVDPGVVTAMSNIVGAAELEVRVGYFGIFVSSVFVLVSVLWQHTASVAASTIAQDMGNGSVKSGVGTSAMVLGWFGFVLLVVVTIGLLVMILSISLIRKLTDED